MSVSGTPIRRIPFDLNVYSLLIFLALMGCGRTEIQKAGERALLTGTLERGTEGGIYVHACDSDRTYRLMDEEGYLDSAGSFASVYAVSSERGGREAWQVQRVNYVPIEGFGCAFDWRGTLWRAAGNEPFWAAHVSENLLKLRFPGFSEKDILVIPVSREQGPVFEGDGVTLLFSNRTCQDTMADTVYGWVSTLEFNGTRYQGCGFQGMAEQPTKP